METNNYYNYTFLTIFLYLFLRFPSLIRSSEHIFDQSLDAILHERAFGVMMHSHPHTGALYNATLPASLAGIKASVVRLRSTTLWKQGANFSDIVIPPGTLPVPHVKRLLIVYNNLYNWSASFYSLPGYALISPVVGFLVYDATHLRSRNLSNIELNMMGKQISIKFHDSSGLNNRRTKCVCFGGLGRVEISEMRLPGVCYSRSQGHFTIAVPVVKKKQRIWPFWIMGSLAGFVGLILVGLAGVVAARSFVGKRTQEMEKEADEGECLQTYWISSSKMPLAEVTRTQPVLESTSLPNPKLSWYA